MTEYDSYERVNAARRYMQMMGINLNMVVFIIIIIAIITIVIIIIITAVVLFVIVTAIIHSMGRLLSINMPEMILVGNKSFHVLHRNNHDHHHHDQGCA